MRLGWFVARAIVRAIFVYVFRGRIFGVNHVPVRGGVLLVSNHQSFFDPVLLSLGLPRETHHMARDTLFNKRRFATLIRWLNAFPVKRGSADLGAIREAVKRLRDGQLVIVYPEGTRTRDGEVGPMHAGIMLMARRAGVPVVPALVCGAYEVWPRSASLPTLQPVLVAYGPPISAAELSQLSDEQSIALIRERIISMRARSLTHPLMAHIRKRP